MFGKRFETQTVRCAGPKVIRAQQGQGNVIDLDYRFSPDEPAVDAIVAIDRKTKQAVLVNCPGMTEAAEQNTYFGCANCRGKITDVFNEPNEHAFGLPNDRFFSRTAGTTLRASCRFDS